MRKNIRNTTEYFGWVSILLHWVMAITIIGLFFLGDYMVELTYYDAWYKQAPALHKSIGVCIFALLITRIAWHLYSKTPKPLAKSQSFTALLALATHKILYLLILLTTLSGYLISTAKGQGISVFAWFELPALPTQINNQEDIAGDIHHLLAHMLLFLAIGHAAVALKHHFWNKDKTLKRMLGL